MQTIGACALALLTSLALAQEVIVDGLTGPMGVMIAPDGAVWVIDSGTGGDDERLTMFSPAAGQTVEAGIGMTTQVVRVAPDGTRSVVAELPSIDLGDEYAGGARLAMLDGEVYATAGIWVEFAGDDAYPQMATVVRIGEMGVDTVADLWTFENAVNPDGFIRESHPYGLLAGPDGRLWIADAGANTVLAVDPANGELELIATLDGVPAPFPNPARAERMETDPVPTGIALGADGAVYVASLPGVPFTPGSASVLRMNDDGAFEPWSEGLTMLTDLTLGPDGNLYAVQFAVFGEQGPQPGSGALVRVHEGEHEVVVDGLVFPTSVAFDDEGHAYVTTNGFGFFAVDEGQVVRYAGIAAP